MRPWISRARGASLVVGLAVGVSVPVVAISAPSAGAALRPVVGCPFHVGNSIEQGAAGTLYFTVELRPDSAAERCTVAVTFTTTIRGSIAPYTNIAGNPLTSTQTVSFAPGRLTPVLGVRWGGLHCADPVGPGTITFSVEGRVSSFPVSPSTCGGVPSSLLEPFPIDVVSEVGIAPTPDNHGYRTVDERGVITAEGDATSFTTAPTSFPVVAIQTAPTGNGVWTVASDGGVFAYGSAAFHGSTGNLHLNRPVVGMAATPDGGGYWLVASDGGVFTFGDATFHGSLGALHLNAPVVGMAATPDGGGYWLVASDGGVFAFGDAGFAGSMGAVLLNAPVVSIAAGPHGGYWLLASDGGVFTFGGVPYEGSIAVAANGPTRSGIAATASGHGYWTVGADNSIANFGDAGFFGSDPIGGARR
jgi:uncharacterized membrane protein YgdD (TMEM256/DUF423 family)